MKLKKITLAILLMINIPIHSYGQSLGVPEEINFTNTVSDILGGDDKTQQNHIPEGSAGYLYNMGTGPVDRISLPPQSRLTRNYRARWSAGTGYSCGKFDPFSNVEQVINKAISKFKEMPQMFVTGAQEAVAALPAYLLNKMNPALYNVVTKNLDDSFDLFQLKFKSCRQLENEIANHGNPYYDYVKAAKADLQRLLIRVNDGTKTIDEVVNQTEKEGSENGVVSVGGERKGGEGQEPFSAMVDVSIAGYNLIIGRENTADKSAPTDKKNFPIVNVFSSPEVMADWFVKIYGNRVWNLSTKNVQNPNQEANGLVSKPGASMRYQYQAHRHHLYELLVHLVNGDLSLNEFTEKTGGIRLAPAQLIDIQETEPYARQITINLLAQEEAIRDMQMRLRYVKDSLVAGLEEPSIAQSTAASKIRQEILEFIDRIDRNLYELSQIRDQG